MIEVVKRLVQMRRYGLEWQAGRFGTALGDVGQ